MTSLAEEYLALRRKLGFRLEKPGRELLNFAGYADRVGHEGAITTEMAVRWAKLPHGADPLWRARRLDVVRRFARYRIAVDPGTEVPPAGMLGPSYRRKPPHIYSEDEIASLLGAAASLRPAAGLRPHTYTTLLGLLASTGLRISEALRLDRTDVDLGTGVLTIVETKFHKSRLVPLHPSSTAALSAYAERRDRRHPLLRNGAFLVSDVGSRLGYGGVRCTFVELRRRLGWLPQPGRRPPRIHDLRHTFACRRLLAWYQDGSEIHTKMPVLSTYLGHVKVTDTYWYLTAVPELMAIASARFEASREVR